MKKYNLLLLALLLIITSCSKEGEEILVPIDYSGQYSGSINCTGTLSEDNNATMMIIVTKELNSENYTVDFGDDIIFKAYNNGTSLVIDRQTINESYEFDVITMSGSMKLLDKNLYAIEFYHQVDDEESSDCTSTLTKNI
jgi:hypothetical protein